MTMGKHYRAIRDRQLELELIQIDNLYNLNEKLVNSDDVNTSIKRSIDITEHLFKQLNFTDVALNENKLTYYLDESMDYLATKFPTGVVLEKKPEIFDIGRLTEHQKDIVISKETKFKNHFLNRMVKTRPHFYNNLLYRKEIQDHYNERVFKRCALTSPRLSLAQEITARHVYARLENMQYYAPETKIVPVGNSFGIRFYSPHFEYMFDLKNALREKKLVFDTLVFCKK